MKGGSSAQMQVDAIAGSPVFVVGNPPARSHGGDRSVEEIGAALSREGCGFT